MRLVWVAVVVALVMCTTAVASPALRLGRAHDAARAYERAMNDRHSWSRVDGCWRRGSRHAVCKVSFFNIEGPVAGSRGDYSERLRIAHIKNRITVTSVWTGTWIYHDNRVTPVDRGPFQVAP